LIIDKIVTNIPNPIGEPIAPQKALLQPFLINSLIHIGKSLLELLHKQIQAHQIALHLLNPILLALLDEHFQLPLIHIKVVLNIRQRHERFVLLPDLGGLWLVFV
jgi:hypothetical protein